MRILFLFFKLKMLYVYQQLSNMIGDFEEQDNTAKVAKTKKIAKQKNRNSSYIKSRADRKETHDQQKYNSSSEDSQSSSSYQSDTDNNEQESDEIVTHPNKVDQHISQQSSNHQIQQQNEQTDQNTLTSLPANLKKKSQYSLFIEQNRARALMRQKSKVNGISPTDHNQFQQSQQKQNCYYIGDEDENTEEMDDEYEETSSQEDNPQELVLYDEYEDEYGQDSDSDEPIYQQEEEEFQKIWNQNSKKNSPFKITQNVSQPSNRKSEEINTRVFDFVNNYGPNPLFNIDSFHKTAKQQHLNKLGEDYIKRLFQQGGKYKQNTATNAENKCKVDESNQQQEQKQVVERDQQVQENRQEQSKCETGQKNIKGQYKVYQRKINFANFISVKCFKKDEEVTIMGDKLQTEEIINYREKAPTIKAQMQKISKFQLQQMFSSPVSLTPMMTQQNFLNLLKEVQIQNPNLKVNFISPEQTKQPCPNVPTPTIPSQPVEQNLSNNENINNEYNIASNEIQNHSLVAIDENVLTETNLQKEREPINEGTFDEGMKDVLQIQKQVHDQQLLIQQFFQNPAANIQTL